MTDLHAPGAKDDAEKIDWTYITDYFPHAVAAIGESMDGLRTDDCELEFFAQGEYVCAAILTCELMGNAPDVSDSDAKSLLSAAIQCYPYPLEEVCKLSAAGAKKYSRGGWRTVDNGLQRYKAAYLRHWVARNARGETVSEDMGILHLTHELWNLLAIIELS